MMGRFCFARQQLIPVLMTGSGDQVDVSCQDYATWWLHYSPSILGHHRAVDSVCLSQLGPC